MELSFAGEEDQLAWVLISKRLFVEISVNRLYSEACSGQQMLNFVAEEVAHGRRID